MNLVDRIKEMNSIAIFEISTVESKDESLIRPHVN